MDGICSEDFAERVRINQSRLSSSEMKSQYDFIICGSGSSGSVVARRLAENPEVSVLLIEAGGADNVPSVNEPGRWFLNLGSERDWNFRAEPSSHLNGRVIPMNMGKVLGGGSSINVMAWMRGHRNDWDFFATEAGDPAWSYKSNLNIYRRIEDWRGAPDPDRRGVGGPVFVQPAPDPHPIASATLEAARSVGIPTFDSPNGRMMEGEGGCSVMDVLIRNGRRQSIFRAYTFPHMDRPNLTVLTQTQVIKVTFEGRRATGVELVYDGKHFRIGAGREIVLSLGAINTPKVLMHSGIGDQSALPSFGIPVVQHLPGVGQNFQDHAGIGCLCEHPEFPPPRNNAAEVTFFWKSDSSFETPDLQTCQGEIPIPSIETAAQFAPPAKSWTMLAGVVRPKSRGRVYLSGPDPDDPVRIEANLRSHPDDIKAALACVELCREIGNSQPLRSFARREVMPGNLKGLELQTFIRDGAISYWHQSGTARMGRDATSVVDGELRVVRAQESPDCGRVHHAPRDDRKHFGAMRCHWRARRRDAEDRPRAGEPRQQQGGAAMRTSHAVILSRLQFSFTISFHIIFPAFTIGIAAWLTVLEALHLKTGRPAYRVLFEFWLKTFGVAFGLGVVSRENGARAAILGSGALLGESQFSVSARPRFFYG